MSLPYVITILVTAGDPDGVRVVEKSNWTGRGFVFARSDLALALEQDLAFPGVYLLIGDDPGETFESQIYIGESENVGVRLKQHQGSDKKDFWNTTVVFVSPNRSLNKAHVLHIEASLLRLATEAKRVLLANGKNETPPSLSAVDLAVVEGFLAELVAIYPVLGIDAFDVVESMPSTRRRYYLDGSGGKGEGEERSDGFIVFAGASSRIEEVASLQASFARIRRRLLERGVLKEDGGAYRLTEDTVFKSPSTAAMVLMGRNANGRTNWKDGDGVTLKEHQIADAGGVE